MSGPAPTPWTVARMMRHTRPGTNGCLVWQLSPSNPKPQIEIKGVLVRVTRLMYQMVSGEAIPRGMVVCHKCDNPRCVAFDHLYLGSLKRNRRDVSASRRTPTQRMTWAAVRVVRHMKGSFTRSEVAELFGVSKQNVSDAWRAKRRSFSWMKSGGPWDVPRQSLLR